MATIDKPARTRNAAEASRRVLDPLQRLRGYIRLYVSLEAVAIVVLFVAACFWIGLLFDYGAFKLPRGMSIDWVQELPRWLRATVTLGVIYGILLLIAAYAINRLLQRFRDVALALELERRFPKLLGDRLITAVELANRRKVLEQGYSAAMVDETIVEAAERVEKLPIKQVFRWGRLWFMGFFILFLTVGLYLFTGAGFAAVLYKQGLVNSVEDYNEVLTIYIERNILLQNTIWPRKSYLVFISPEDANIRIGRDKLPPEIRVRAWQYVIADSNAPNREGWRQLKWTDLETRENLIGEKAEAAPPDWKVHDGNIGLTVDEVDLFFKKFNIRKSETNTAKADEQPLYAFPNGKSSIPSHWGMVDKTTDAGWRELAWKDLGSEYLNGFRAPTLPNTWEPPLTPSVGYTVDEVEKALKQPAPSTVPVLVDASKGVWHLDLETPYLKAYAEMLADARQVLNHLERLNGMRKALDKLDARVAGSGSRRTLRKLVVPTEVMVSVRGPSATTTVTLTKVSETENEYTGQFAKLEEKVAKDSWVYTYFARGEDYTTRERTLTSVPPPALTNLYREDDRPAYLYYTPGGGRDVTAADVKGKRQPLARSTVSLMGGNTVILDCPAGTDLTLIGETDKDLSKVELLQYEGDAMPIPVATIDSNKKSFRVTLPNVRQKRSYHVEMTDTDNVVGRRDFKISVAKDTPPSVDLAVFDNNMPGGWVRKTKDGYMVTNLARVPFIGKEIKDDNGLTKVNYAYTISKIESTAVLDVHAMFMSGTVPLMIPQTGGALNGLWSLVDGKKEWDKMKNAQEGGNVDLYYPDKNHSIKAFEQALGNHPDQFVSKNRLDELLGSRQPDKFRRLLKDFPFMPDPMKDDLTDDPLLRDFPVRELTDLSRDEKRPMRYRILVRVEATDTDLDSTLALDGADGPNIGRSKDVYMLLVVPEADLIAEINKDEEDLSDKMSNALAHMIDTREKLSVALNDLEAISQNKPEELSPLSVRLETLDDEVNKAQLLTKEVLAKYQTIFKELKGNNIQNDKKKVVATQIIPPLSSVDKLEFDDARGKLQAVRKDLDAKVSVNDVKGNARKSGRAAIDQVQAVIDQLQAIMDKMQKQIELNAIVEKARLILQAQETQRIVIQTIYKIVRQRALGDDIPLP